MIGERATAVQVKEKKEANKESLNTVEIVEDLTNTTDISDDEASDTESENNKLEEQINDNNYQMDTKEITEDLFEILPFKEITLSIDNHEYIPKFCDAAAKHNYKVFIQ